ncbi:MAG: UDP-N-acetylmuramoyl-L-alanine--D-glutamate ligase [Nitrospirae bacterium]|nr:MAG: UDP-N-acetylmuramoyl-L-alanine--D-glutamate ligase [Nitrospirota bacterium]
MRSFKDIKVLVVGLGRSGFGAVKLLKALGAKVMVSEQRSLSEEELRALENGIFLQMGPHKVELVDEAELIVVSPGVPPENPLIKRAEALGKRTISEIELTWQASSHLVPNWIAITGTNGKTTTTTLVDEMLKASGIKVLTGGNIGTAISSLVVDKLLGPKPESIDWINIEVSSFQLERIEHFRPRISTILNISEDHLDRYPDMTSYINAKTNMWKNINGEDMVVLNDDDPIVRELRPPEGAKIYRFSRQRQLEGAYIKDGKIYIRVEGVEKPVIAVDDLLIKGVHNQENALASSLIAFLAGADEEAISHVLRTFPGLPHRLQFVAEIDGVRFYDDSKATNVASVIKSVESFGVPVILILGGQDKGLDFRPLRRLKNIKAIVAIGEALPKIMGHLDGYFPIHTGPDMEAAVNIAFSLARDSEVVLLSPGCASFDMFEDYAHRGRVFQEAVRQLKGGRVKC